LHTAKDILHENRRLQTRIRGCDSGSLHLRKGATVVGIDVNPQKVEIANGGHSPVKEPGVDEAFAKARTENRLTAATTPGRALADADVVIACVGNSEL
jgi:UDP-glucose 6-dehydrogenase